MRTLSGEMNPRTPTSEGSSTASGPPARLRPQRSRVLLLWWWGIHGAAALGLVLTSFGLPWKCLALLGLTSHAVWRYPPRVPGLVRGCAGEWAVPDLGRSGLQLSPESRDGGWWIRLALTDAQGSLGWVLLSDQLDPDAWRALQAELRRRGQIKSSQRQDCC